ncbi:hypothetical protein KI387_029971, partial [Taxus chinensis]
DFGTTEYTKERDVIAFFEVEDNEDFNEERKMIDFSRTINNMVIYRSYKEDKKVDKHIMELIIMLTKHEEGWRNIFSLMSLLHVQ